jgi:hypothetical protein
LIFMMFIHLFCRGCIHRCILFNGYHRLGILLQPL